MINIVLLPLRRPQDLTETLSDDCLAILDVLLELAMRIGGRGPHVRVAAFCQDTHCLYELPHRKKTLIGDVLGDYAHDFRLMVEFFIGQSHSIDPVGVVLLNPGFFLAEKPDYDRLVCHAQRFGIAVGTMPAGHDVCAAAFSSEYMRDRWDDILELSKLLTVCVDNPTDYSRSKFDRAHLVRPGSTFLENSFAISDIEGPDSRCPRGAARHLNTALEETFFNTVSRTRTAGDPVAVGDVLLARIVRKASIPALKSVPDERNSMINIVLLPLRRPQHLTGTLPDAGLVFLDGLRTLAMGICGSDVRLGGVCRDTLRFYELPSANKMLIRDVLGYRVLDLKLMVEFFIESHPIRPEGVVLITPSFLLGEKPDYKGLVRHALRHGLSVAGMPASRDVYAAAFSVDYMRDRWSEVIELSSLLTVCVDDPIDYPWSKMDRAHFVRPSSTGVENSPAINGIDMPVGLRAHDAPCYLNTALEEILFHTVNGEKAADDPQRMREVLAAHRSISKVPWIFNELLNEIEYRMGSPEPWSTPPEIHLSMTGACNISCKFCSYAKEIARFDFIAPDQVQNLGILRYARTLRLSSGLGEPTLNPHLRTILDTIVENFPQIGINFFTNGVLLNRKNLLSSLVNHGVRWINVSMNAAGRQTWAQLHGADRFDRVSRNLMELLQEKRACRSLHPIVCGSMVLTRLNIDELPKMPGLCRELGIDRFTAFPFFGFGYGGVGKFGPKDAYHCESEHYERVYWKTLREGEKYRVSLELPQPDVLKTAAFGTEERLLHDFARIEANEMRLGKLLNRMKFTSPPGAHCFFLWRQVGIGSTNKTLGETPETHYIYPCLGPLSSLNFARLSPVHFTGVEDFLSAWRNPVFKLLREAQHKSGISEVCDLCRSNDTRDPIAFPKMNKAVATFLEELKLHSSRTNSGRSS
ncbi:MAG: radical SAM protein [Syntrophobacteraceae bacterium]|jgi:MoaA/NifB/PqqE/SkfB family radical SAM enzyme